MQFRSSVQASLLFWVFFLSMGSVFAHGGPTYPILEDQPSGPYRISVWADPDVGNALFYVLVQNPTDGKMADDVTVSLGVQPLTGGLPETLYPTERRTRNGQSQYVAQVGENTEGMWRIRTAVVGPRGQGEVITQVKAFPVGLGTWDIALYVFPFAAIGLVFLKGFLSRMRVPPPRSAAEKRLS